MSDGDMMDFALSAWQIPTSTAQLLESFKAAPRRRNTGTYMTRRQTVLHYCEFSLVLPSLFDKGRR